MKIRRLTLALALTSLLPSGIASAEVPFCGGSNIDIGGGFDLTMYMFDRSPAFDLEYAVPEADIRARDSVVAAKPIKLTFAGFEANSTGDPRIGYAHLDLREPQGQRFEAGAMQLDCGGGTTLSASFSYSSPSLPPAPDRFDSPFFADRANIPACISALQKSGRFTLAFFRTGSSAPSLTLQGEVPLQNAIRTAKKRWKRYLKEANAGQCQIMAAPPPPFSRLLLQKGSLSRRQPQSVESAAWTLQKAVAERRLSTKQRPKAV